MSKPTALVILHPGFEEMEAVAPIDLLARADVEVTQASLSGEELVAGRNGMTLQADTPLADLPAERIFDAVVLPGGPGINQIRNHPELVARLKQHHAAGKLVACICAAPLLLLDSGLLSDIRYTAHPATTSELPDPEDAAIVFEKNILTSRGAGTATEFGLALVEALTDEATRNEVADSICWRHG